MSRCLSAPDAISPSLPQGNTAKTKMLSVVRNQQKEYLVLCTVTSMLLVSIVVFFTKYLTSTNIPTAQQKKGHKKVLVPHCPDKRGSTELNHFDCNK